MHETISNAEVLVVQLALCALAVTGLSRMLMKEWLDMREEYERRTRRWRR